MSIQKAIINEEVEFLTSYFLGIKLTPVQAEIVRTIAYGKEKRVAVCAMTRYGKTQCVAISVCFYILMNHNKKVNLIAPKIEQAFILRNYMMDIINKFEPLRNILDLGGSRLETLGKEASKKRQTFKNGCEYQVFSAHNEANGLMGFGGDLIIKDEACLISREADAKISRMLGDNAKDSIFVELFNPWDTDNIAFQDWTNKDFFKFHVPWEKAVEEGRTTKEFVDEMRDRLPALAFTVLYDSEFPDQPEDSLFNIKWIRQCQNSRLTIYKEYLILKERLGIAHKFTEREASETKEKLKNYKLVIACDPADKGLDMTVIYVGIQKGNEYEVIEHYSEAVSDNMSIASTMWDLHKKYVVDELRIDGHGLGIGVISRLQQLVKENKLTKFGKVNVRSCLFGGAVDDSEKQIYKNLKAKNYFRLARIMKDSRIKIPSLEVLMSELSKIKWEKSSNETNKIVDPEDKSPDFADALVYLVWEDSSPFAFSFG